MLNALKRRIAHKMAQRGYVRTLVKQDIVQDPEFLEMLAQSFREDPGRFSALLQHSGFFSEVLAHLSANPEAMYEMLQNPRFRRRLRAQGDLIRGIAGDSRLMAAILKQVPSAWRSEMLRTLLEKDARVLEDLQEDGPFLAAALLHVAREPSLDGDDSDGENENERQRVQAAQWALVQLAASDSAGFVAALSERDPGCLPALIANDTVWPQISALIASDRAALADILTLAATQLRDGRTAAERMCATLDILADVPAFRTAMQRDPALRRKLAELARDSYDSAGLDMDADFAADPDAAA